MGPPFAARLRGHVRASAIPPGLNTDTPPGVAAEHAILRGPRPHIAPTGLDSLALVPGSSTLTPAFAPFSQWPPHSPPCRRLPSPSAPRAGSPAGPRPCSGTRARARAPSARSPWPTKTARACSRPARLPPGGSRSPTGFPPRVLPSGAAADGSRPSLPTPGSTSSAPATSTTSQPSNEGQALPSGGIVLGVATDTLTISAPTLGTAGGFDCVASTACGGARFKLARFAYCCDGDLARPITVICTGNCP